MTCEKHPFAHPQGPLCPACLLEVALAPHEPFRQLTIHLPLGHSAAASVFLVRQDAPLTGLLRLKTWHRTAPDGFLDRFRALQRHLDQAADLSIGRPLAATVSATGLPSVLSDFRQGVPMLDAVRSGTLTPHAAAALLSPLIEVMRAAHDRGLSHGSIVPGNVIVRPDLAEAFFVDFGLAPLWLPTSSPAALIASDQAGLKSLLVTFQSAS